MSTGNYRKRKIITSLVVLLLIGAVAIFVIRVLGGPAEGTVKQITSRSSVDSNETLKKFGQIDGTYIRFSYPAAYQLSNRTPESNDYERYILTGRTLISQLLAVTVAPLPNSRLEDMSGYAVRKQQPELYKEEKMTIGTNEVIIMNKITEYERVAFLAHEDKVATVALTSNSPETAVLDADLRMVLESWQWK